MAKRLVVCLDGTWNTPDSARGPTNVVKLMRAVETAGQDGRPQVTFYDAGVGTSGGRISRAVAGAFGDGLDENVRDGYRFLANNYEDGDEIYVFGFSRGAFTARSLVGFISACGLLPKDRMAKLMRAWNVYRLPPDERKTSPDYQVIKRVSRFGVRITCLGVWDTVGSLGVPGEIFEFLNREHRFHDAELSDIVDAAFHAIAIDEKRGPFQPTLWQKDVDKDLGRQVVEQVWFAGVHGNVGGGVEDSRMSDLALRWMIDRVRAHSGLHFDEGYVDTLNDDDVTGEIYETRTLLYSWSKVHPFVRLIDQKEVERRFLQCLSERHNRPDAGKEFVNEMIHWSAAARFGERALQDGEMRVYEPENLKVALEAEVPVVSPDEQRRGPEPVVSAAE